MNTNAFKYSPELDGLRALAILSVFVFHINPKYLPGGFVGVDIFFVISGYLITSIIKQHSDFSFSSLKDFYSKRIKRILPPLYFLLFVVSLVSFFLLTPSDYANLKTFTERTIAFSANVYQISRDGYFGPAAQQLPLLHTWSLSIEEQFYFIWPVLYIILKKHTKLLVISIVSIIIVSISYAEYLLSHEFSKVAYLSFASRCCELLLGIFLVYVPKVPLHKYLSIFTYFFGFLLITSSFALISEHSHFPGIMSLYPTIGTCLVIYAIFNGEKNFFSWALSLNFVNYIGKTSYSLYLWHWPILALVRYSKNTNDLDVYSIIISVTLTFFLSHLSYSFIETPLKSFKPDFKKAIFKIFLVPALAIMSLMFISLQSLRTIFANTSSTCTIATDSEPSHDTGSIFVQNRGTKRVLIFGDSHASQLFSFTKEISNEKNISFDFLTGRCPPVIPDKFNKMGFISNTNICNKMNKHLYQYTQTYEAILIVGRWDLYLKGIDSRIDFLSDLKNTIKILKKGPAKISIATQVPKMTDGFCKKNRILFAKNYSEEDISIYNKIIKKIAFEENIELLDLYMITKESQIPLEQLHSDENHISQQGSEKLGQFFRDHWKPIFGKI